MKCIWYEMNRDKVPARDPIEIHYYEHKKQEAEERVKEWEAQRKASNDIK